MDIEIIETTDKPITDIDRLMLNVFNGDKQIKNIDKEAVYYNSREITEEIR